VALWLLLRVVFFEGLWGFDDLHHVNFALNPNEHPQNHWEARLLFNGLIALSINVFGFAEWVLAVPGMFGSLIFIIATWWTARSLWDNSTGLLAGVMACFLVLDITHTTYPAANSLANGLCALGTGMVVATEKRSSFLLGGLLLGLSIFVHMAMLFFVVILSATLIISDWPRFEWQKGLILLTTALVCFLGLNLSTYAILTGDPLYQFSIVAKTHLPNQNFSISLWLPGGEINPAWVRWPFVNFIFSKAFGMLISIPVGLALINWSRLEHSMRFMVLTIVFYWAYVCFGSQHPFRFLPLDHDTRYWYPLALPACILIAGVVMQYYRKNILRYVVTALLLGMNVFLLISSGSWGQNVEISKELLRFAETHPNRIFVTDSHTYNEMFILLGGHKPKNVGLLAESKTLFDDLDSSILCSTDDPELRVLYNPLQNWRKHIQPYLNSVSNFERQEIAPNRYRTIAYLLPTALRERYPLLIRKPAAQLGSPAVDKNL
jgi:hypothetical protein